MIDNIEETTPPSFLSRFVARGIVTGGGLVTVKAPKELTGKQALFVQLSDCAYAGQVESHVYSRGWVPKSYRSWDGKNSDTRTISFIQKEDWRAYELLGLVDTLYPPEPEACPCCGR